MCFPILVKSTAQVQSDTNIQIGNEKPSYSKYICFDGKVILNYA